MRERRRLIVESAGALLVIAALIMVHVALGVMVGGLLLIAVANFYMKGDEDAGS